MSMSHIIAESMGAALKGQQDKESNEFTVEKIDAMTEKCETSIEIVQAKLEMVETELATEIKPIKPRTKS